MTIFGVKKEEFDDIDIKEEIPKYKYEDYSNLDPPSLRQLLFNFSFLRLQPQFYNKSRNTSIISRS